VLCYKFIRLENASKHAIGCQFNVAVVMILLIYIPSVISRVIVTV